MSDNRKYREKQKKSRQQLNCILIVTNICRIRQKELFIFKKHKKKYVEAYFPYYMYLLIVYVTTTLYCRTYMTTTKKVS